MSRRDTAEIIDRISSFEILPESAHLDIAEVRAITGKSRATLYRWVDKGVLPKPRRLGSSQNYWTVGEIRRALSVE